MHLLRKWDTLVRRLSTVDYSTSICNLQQSTRASVPLGALCRCCRFPQHTLQYNRLLAATQNANRTPPMGPTFARLACPKLENFLLYTHLSQDRCKRIFVHNSTRTCFQVSDSARSSCVVRGERRSQKYTNTERTLG